ncbi:pseudouridine synthase [Thalassobacter stenotrophicus]|uniref:pseudouridine synthase n=1 Tax=Thalassobacter stenotrophicus TaxID=266809 RepID=UPI000D5FA617|nr:pseudouridine synthase [Thalassobacter stenotrophicus]PVZ48812.1 pseudouridine synthase [Thalassobacter stenotrophicus]
MSNTSPSKSAPPGDRIAKVIARAGIASRRDAEVIIAEGRVTVNGQVIESAALNVTDEDRVAVDGVPLAPPERARLWMYHKPTGLVTTTRDEQGRETVFDALPDDLPRVMTVGRLDLNSEGLLLLTNDGELKRRLELPSTGWLRRYRVRVRGTPTEAQLEAMRGGLTVEGERFAPMQVAFDRQQGGNAWLTLGLREGKNREIRRAMESQGLLVNRLIRLSYGPFQLGTLAIGEIEEVRTRVLRDQLGEPEMADETETRAPGKPGPGGRKPGGKPAGKFGGKPAGKFGGKPGGRPGGKPGEDRGDRPARKPYGKPGEDRGDRPARKPYGKPGEDRGDRPARKPYGKPGEDRGDRPARKPYGKPGEDRGDRPARKPYGKPGEDRGDRPARKPYGKPGEDRGDRPARKPYGKPGEDRGDRPARKPYGKPGEDRGDRPARKPYGEDRGDRKPFGKDRPDNDRSARREAEQAERAEKKKQFLSNPGMSLRKDAKGAPKRGSARKGGAKSPGAGFYGSRDLSSKKPTKP